MFIITKLILAGLFIITIGFLDYYTGVEIRIFPLYFFPIVYGSWNTGLKGSLLLTFLASLTWLLSNYFAGLHFSSRLVLLFNTFSQVSSFMLVGVLIAILKKSVDKEKNLAMHDGLTGLLNARAFFVQLDYEIERSKRSEEPLTIGYIDLDNFKQVNDEFGHQKGDELLKLFSSTVKKLLRKTDFIARLGGDEFAIILPDCNQEHGNKTFQKIQSELEAVFKQMNLPVTASIGVATFPTPLDDSKQMILIVDAAMYRAKNSGKNKIEFVS